ILIANKSKLDAISAALLEYETLDGSQIREIMQHGYMINPPKDKPKPPSPPPVPKATENRPVTQDDEGLGGLPGGLAGVPA
ncbi:MAG TPA: cell division protein FtsH, partial [Prosthecobacter sp.]